MDLSNRTVLIVGGTSGIGRELARRFAAAGSTVAVGGRSAQALADPSDPSELSELSELSDEGIGTFGIDVTDGASVTRARDAVLARYPGLDTVVTMSGVMLLEDLRDPAGHFEAARTTIDTNLVGTIRVIDAFTPHLVRRGAGTFVTVTSGIAFLPFPPMPTYAASKAAVHAYSEALRAQLAGTGVGVVELVPPAVATAGQEKVNPHALPLDDFATEVMGLLSQNPTPDEILVERVLMHRWAERDGTYDDLVAQRSQALAMLPGRRG
ncbi:SDR family oxidoreductase [Streptomyces sp. NPDC096310]|uniref:SDR family oxidoreductase n=1 Tax=Streptomyces sp. NPDC096310 TaxID=3366082 RepID=UPI00382F2761